MLLLLVELLLVELKLGTLEDVSVGSANLSGSAGDAGEETAGVELVGEDGVQGLGRGGTAGLEGGAVTGLLDLLGVDGLLAELDTVSGLVVVLEESGINHDDGVLHDAVGSDHLVGGGVEDNGDDLALEGGVCSHLIKTHTHTCLHTLALLNRRIRVGDSLTLRAPGEVAAVDTESAVLDVSATASDEVDGVGAKLGVGGRTSELVLPLLLVDGALATRGASLVARVSVDTHPAATLRAKKLCGRSLIVYKFFRLLLRSVPP